MLTDRPSKRKRSAGGGASTSSRTLAQKKALWSSYYTNKKYPRDQYYRRYFRRDAESRAKYGVSYAKATKDQRAARKGADMMGKGLYMRGRGGFFGDLWKQRSRIFDGANAAGKAMGLGHITGPIRQALKASGIGGYEVSTNDLINGGNQNTFQAPSFTPVSDTGAILMSNREYISNVYGPPSAGFSVQSYDLNPGIEASFPFLAQIASNYSEYSFVQLIFSFKSSVTDFQTTTGVAGQVLTATQYNTDEEPFSDKQSMMVYHGANSSKSTGNMMSGVECDPAKLAGSHGKFVRYKSLPRGEDQKEYDLGRFSIATVDFPDKLQNQAIGELWVSYTVVLRRPKLTVSRGLAISQDLLGVSPLAGAASCPGTQIVASPGVGNTCIPWSQEPGELISASGNNIGVVVALGDHRVTNTDLLAGNTPTDFFPNLGSHGAVLGSSTWPGITAGGCQELKILFPGDYSGDVRIVYSATSADPDSACEWISCGARSEGQVEGISDMLAGVRNGVGFQDGSGIYISSAAQTNQSVCILGGGNQIETKVSGPPTSAFLCHVELHVRIQQALGGVDNAVYLQIMNTKQGGAPVAISNAQITVAEYNSGYTRKGTGLIDWQIAATEDGRPLPMPMVGNSPA